MSLVRAERRRLFRRRFTRYMLVIAVLVPGAVVVGTWFSNTKVGPTQIAAAEQQARQAYETEVRMHNERCAQMLRQSTVDDRARQFCEDEEAGPRPEHFQAEWFMPPTFDFKNEFGRTLQVLFGILALVAFIIGASFVGAEWNSGGMMNLLIWRPRRIQVLLTKLGTLLAALLSVGLVLSAAWVSAFWAIATFRGSTAKMTPGTWESFALTGARGMALALVAGVIGFGLASFGRHTAMALGTAMGFAVVGYIGVSIALSLIQVRFAERYLWPTYIQAWMDKKRVLEDWNACNFEFTGGVGECRPKSMEITWQDSGLIFSVVTAAILGLAIWTMRRRDVT